MEAIATLSIACNVLQLLDHGFKSVSLCKQIYAQGSADRFPDLQEYSTQLANAAEQLQNSVDMSANPIRKEQQELWNIAQKCVEIARQLRQVMEELSTQEKRKALQAVQLAFKTMRRKSTLAGLEATLSRYQTVLHTRLLVEIR